MMMNEPIRLLLIEDDPDDRLLIQEMLQNSPQDHFVVAEVPRLSAGLAYLEQHSADVVLLDLSLPDCQGLETVTTLQAAGGSIPLIVLTGLADQALALEAMRKGAQDYLVKDQIDAGLLSRAIYYAIERKQAAEALRRSENRLRKIVESIPIGIWVSDRDFNIRLWNAGQEQIIGLSRREMLGQNIFDRLPSFVEAGLQAACQQVIETGRPVLLREHPLYDPGLARMQYYLNIKADSLEDESGQITGLIVAMEDITEQKWAEKALRESERELDLFFSHSLDGYFFLMLDEPVAWDGTEAVLEHIFTRQRVTRFNAAILDLTGLSAARFRGMTPRQFFAPDIEAAKQLWRTLLDQGQLRVERKTQTAQGQPIVIEATYIAIYDEANRFQGNFGIHRDITARKEADEALARQAKELARSNAELEQFAYIASHDLQEPLRMIRNYLQLLGRRYRGRLDTDADEFIDFAVDGATRMQELTRDLLRYSRVGRQEPEPGPVDSEAVLARSLSDLQVTIEEKEAIITYDSLPTVVADETELGQLFQNLVGNSLKFCQEPPPRIYISAAEQPESWLFSVRDNGIGLDPQHAERIFQVFQRLHPRSKYPGTGIGLALCQKIVEHYGGRIWVESEPGQGATFYFTIPKRDPV